jgi:hypothetical protein
MEHTQGAENPTYLKGGQMDNVVMATSVILLTGGVLSILKGLYSMSYGINKL